MQPLIRVSDGRFDSSHFVHVIDTHYVWAACPRSSSLSLFFWLSFAGLSPTFLFLYSKFADMTINLSLILQATRIQEQFPLSVFVFIDSLVVSSLQDAGGYAIPAKKTSSCHTCLLSCFTLVCLSCGRTVGRLDVQSRDYKNFSNGQITAFS